MNRYERIKQSIAASKFPSYRYEQLTNAIFRRRIGNYSQMDILPKALRETLISELGENVCGLTLAREKASAQARKGLFELADGGYIEAVALQYKRGWESFCISSQCGCNFGCQFCATGTIGLRRNLTADEITDQLLYYHLNGHELDSVSFMGMGEALANPHLWEALSLLTNPGLFGLGQRRITISTIGLLPGMEQLVVAYPQINLAFSLHSPFAKQRDELMPINKKYPLHAVLNQLDRHIQTTGRKVFIAYILLHNVNNSMEHARMLADLLRSRGPWAHLYHVDLIPYNPTSKTPRPFTAPGKAGTRQFYDALKSKGISVTVRAQFGSGIDAACGQLHG